MKRFILAIAPLLLAGCPFSNFLDPDQKPAAAPGDQVQVNPFGETAPSQIARVAYTPATDEVSRRVAAVSAKILQTTSQGAIRPVFITTGLPQPMISHQGTTQITITEGMVRKCVTDGQLAAVLCLELGKMAAERGAAGSARASVPARPLPPEVRIGNESCDPFGGAGMMRQMELIKYSQEQPSPAAETSRITDPSYPQTAGRAYLLKAGYTTKDMDEALSLLRGVQQNTQPQQWTPAQP